MGKISKAVSTPSINFMGLVGCIEILITDLSIIHPIIIKFVADGINEQSLDEKLKLNIYRIVQEQLNNIFKHANATHVSVSIRRQAKEIILLISDNGKGYNTSTIRKGVGIRNIMSRAEFFLGSTEITSTVGKGYQLRVELPLAVDNTRRKMPAKIKVRP